MSSSSSSSSSDFFCESRSVQPVRSTVSSPVLKSSTKSAWPLEPRARTSLMTTPVPFAEAMAIPPLDGLHLPQSPVESWHHSSLFQDTQSCSSLPLKSIGNAQASPFSNSLVTAADPLPVAMNTVAKIARTSPAEHPLGPSTMALWRCCPHSSLSHTHGTRSERRCARGGRRALVAVWCQPSKLPRTSNPQKKKTGDFSLDGGMTHRTSDLFYQNTTRNQHNRGH